MNNPVASVKSPQNQAALVFDNVHFSYGALPVFQGITLSIARGKVTGIVGPNGCGKSTLMKIAVGIERLRAGKVFVEGLDMAALSGKQRARQIALLPQMLLPSTMTVKSLVACGRYAYQRPFSRLSEEDHVVIERALSQVNLEDCVEKSVAQLSGGQRQRAYLAMVLAQCPHVMLLDEPTSALDIKAAHEILALVRACAQQYEQTVCMVIHDLDLALRYCDEVVVLERGAVVCIGTPDEVVASGLLERVFDVHVCAAQSSFGRAWTFFPKR